MTMFRNVDTLVDDAGIENIYDQVFTFASGEGQHPLSLYQDKDAEDLCFPSIFCGQRPSSKDERSVPVHYSDTVKWELRSVDRRAAQSVPNIFFLKHKKLQMKQISDKLNLAIRRCRNKDKKITAAEARDSTYLDKFVKLDEGYYIFRQLRNSPAYLEARKKRHFCNDKTAFFAHLVYVIASSWYKMDRSFEDVSKTQWWYWIFWEKARCNDLAGENKTCSERPSNMLKVLRA